MTERTARPRRSRGRRRLVGALALLLAGSALVGLSKEAAAAPVVCDWPLTVGYDGVNVMGPDTQASYWALAYTAIPGARLRIDGTYPDARYFSLTVQDIATITLGSLRDEGLNPRPGSENPFRGPVAAGTGRKYTAYLDFRAPPPVDRRAPNTLYVGKTYDGLPNPGGTLLYRVYVPTDQASQQGGVPLPDVSLEIGPLRFDLGLEMCQPLPPDLGGPGNDLISGRDRPDLLPNQAPSADYTQPPDFVPLREAFFTEPVINALPPQLGQLIPQPNGIPLANIDFPYLASKITRAYGDVVAIRMKAPTFPDTVNGEPVWLPTETRYWSLCAYAAMEEALLRGTGCKTDFLTQPGPDGYVTVVVSDPAHRPDAAIDPEAGVHWLPWGPFNRDYLLYRMGMPDPEWEHGPRKIPEDAPDQAAAAQEVMAEYYPVARYCDPATISDQGIDACFD